jgi:glycosyltransferase involved in cell wall biosynthesis
MAGFLSLLTVQLNCSTQSEACSMSIIEGMSLGLPTIASRCSGNPWLVEDGVTGLLFENNSAEALTAALKQLMDDPALVQNMGNAARAAYEARFTGRIFAANLERVYDEILKKKGGSSR